jgi:small subunit ribosomal protein S1
VSARLAELSRCVGRHCDGRVTSIVELGAFIDVEGATGFLHIDDMSWSGHKDPNGFLWVGKRVTVTVLSVDLEKQRMSLSLRRSEDDPWLRVAARYSLGSSMRAKVLHPSAAIATGRGLFVELEPWVDALVHPSDLPPGQLATEFAAGQYVRVRILSVDVELRRISVSMRES